LNSDNTSLVLVSQIRAVLSILAEITRLPSVEKPAQSTMVESSFSLLVVENYYDKTLVL